MKKFFKEIKEIIEEGIESARNAEPGELPLMAFGPVICVLLTFVLIPVSLYSFYQIIKRAVSKCQ
jgi:hypothetical protein